MWYVLSDYLWFLYKRISIEDKTNDEILNLSGLGLRHAAARIRGVHRTPAPPSALTSSNSNTSESLISPQTPLEKLSTIIVILPHKLLDRTHLKT